MVILIVNYILNVMNADKNIYSWVYSLLKYGDVYLRLYRESDYNDELFKADNIDKVYSARNVLNENFKDTTDESLNEAVKLLGHKGEKSFANGVLRAAVRQKESLPLPDKNKLTKGDAA